MSGPWEKYKAVEQPVTEQDRLSADIAALERELKRAQSSTTVPPEAKSHQINILEAELARLTDQKAQISEPPTPFDFDFEAFKQQQQAQKPAFGMSTTQDLLTGAAGAAAGASAGAIPAAKRATLEGIRQAGEALRGGASTMPVSSAPVTPSYGGERWVKSLTDVNLPGGQMGKADLDLAKGMQSAIGREGAPGFTGGKITPGGIIIGPQAATQIEQAAPKPGALQKAGQAARAAAGSPIVRGGLGGFGVGASGAEAFERARRGDVPGAVMAGTAALGSAASMFPPTSLPGGLVAAGATGALALTDKIRNKLAEEAKNTMQEPTPEELSGAQKPAFMYRPSMRRPQKSRADAISGALLESLDQQLQEFSSAQG